MNSGKIFFGMMLALFALSSVSFAYNLSVYSENASRGAATGSGVFSYGALAPISATANPGYTFQYWYISSGSCPIMNPYNRTTYVNVTSNCTAVAKFNATQMQTYTLTVSASTGGVATGSATGLVNGSIRTITATPNAGYNFTQWSVSGQCSAWNAYARNTTVTVNGNCNVVANFTYTGPLYGLSLFASPQAGGSTTPMYAVGLMPGALVSINATPATSYAFSRWVLTFGNCVIANATRSATTLTMGNANCGVNATFVTTGMPDLIISNLTLNGPVYVNQRVYGSVETKNSGIGVAANSTTAYYINGGYVNAVAVPSLGSGASNIGTITFICTRTGTYTLSASADSRGVVAEGNEGNNGKMTKYTCSTAPATKQIVAKAPKSYAYASLFDDIGNIGSGLLYLIGLGR